MSELASALTGVDGERVALCDVAVAAVLQDLLAEVTVAQTYRNDEDVNIEAVYAFPLPLGAVLLDLEIDIGGRVLEGVVVGKRDAEEGYEDAVAAGDAAVMLEAVEPGLYTMNVGNLLPRETVRITFRYALLHRWAGDGLRFFLPTTIAPRYGVSPLLRHRAPRASLTVENQFSLRVEVSGALRDAQFTCPSHAIELARSPDKVVLSLRQAKAVMDRDFVLHVKAPQAARSFVLCGCDGAGATAIASFQPFFPGLRQPRPLALAIVVDCSGSMQGDSMEQAKEALDRILETLQEHDRVTVVAFGSSVRVWSNRLLPCTRTNLARARRFAHSLADMGGTEIGNALQVAHAALEGAGEADIFLVTDGEVSDWGAVVDDARTRGHRVFTVGVGSAVSEAFVRGLATATGGECELVSPREDMAGRVVRHFERMRAPRAKHVAVRWPDGATGITPASIGTVFEGDTVVACASFEHPVAGEAVLEVETDQGETVRQALAIPSPPIDSHVDGVSTVARVAAAARLREADDATGLQTALRYRLVSPWTNWLVVAPRADGGKAADLPALRIIPQTLAAGWGGSGGVRFSRMLHCAPHFLRRQPGGNFLHADLDYCAPHLAETPLAPTRADLPEPLRRLLELIDANPTRLDLAQAFDLLVESGLVAEFADDFRRAAKLGLAPEAVAAALVNELLRSPLGELASGDAQAALVAFRDRTGEMLEALLARDGLYRALTEAATARDPQALEVFRTLSGGRRATVLGFCRRLQGSLRRVTEPLHFGWLVE